MRLLGLVVALAAIGWLFFKSSGGDESSGAIPEPYQESLDRARAVEQTLENSARQTVRTLDEENP